MGQVAGQAVKLWAFDPTAPISWVNAQQLISQGTFKLAPITAYDREAGLLITPITSSQPERGRPLYILHLDTPAGTYKFLYAYTATYRRWGKTVTIASEYLQCVGMAGPNESDLSLTQTYVLPRAVQGALRGEQVTTFFAHLVPGLGAIDSFSNKGTPAKASCTLRVIPCCCWAR